MTIEMIEMIVNKSGISMTKLISELGMTKGQLNYRLKKINDCLIQEQLPMIVKKNQRLYIELTMPEKKQFIETCSSLIHFSDHERVDYIMLILIFSRNESLSSLSERLFVSKNTIFSDMKKIKERLTNQAIQLAYSRKTNYSLSGDELAIRKLGMMLLKEIVEDSIVFHTIQKVLNIDRDLIQEIENRISQLEKEWQVFFSEAKLIQLSYVIYMGILRSSQGFTIKMEWLETYVDPLIYQQIHDIFRDILPGKEEEHDCQFIAIQILSTNTIQNSISQTDPLLMDAIVQAIGNFERLSITQIEEREELSNSLYQHVIPAFYRIKFGVPDSNPLSQEVISEYDYFHKLVESAIQPIEERLNIRFPQQELVYLTIIFLGFLREDLREIKAKKTAVVVCMHGISVSRLLLENLKELFPQIQFTRFMSLREFYEVNPSADFIFSTVYLDTTRQTFIIKHFLNEQEKRELKQKVETELGGGEGSNLPAMVNTTKLMALISQYGHIGDKDHLEKALNHYFSSLEYQEETLEVEEGNRHSLLKLLPLKHIQICDHPLSFQEAIRLVSKPLLKDRSIEPRYVEKILKEYNPDYPYFVVAPETAIPHGGPEDGVNKLSMSLLKLTHPVAFSRELTVRLIVMIAPVNQKGHMDAVSTFYSLVHNSLHLKNILATNYEKELRNYLEQVLMEVNQEYVFKPRNSHAENIF